MAITPGYICDINALTLVGADGALISAYADAVGGGPGGSSAGAERLTLATDVFGRRYGQADGVDNRIAVATIVIDALNWSALMAFQNDDVWPVPGGGGQAYFRGTRADGPNIYCHQGAPTYYDFNQGQGINAPYSLQSPVQDEINIIGFGSSSTVAKFYNNGESVIMPLAGAGGVGITDGATWVGFSLLNEPGFTQGAKGRFYRFVAWPFPLTDQQNIDSEAAMRAPLARNSSLFHLNRTIFIFCGDSITKGAKASVRGIPYADYAIAHAAIATKQYINVSTGGRITSQSEATLVQEVIPHYPANAPDVWVVMGFGSNDFFPGIGGLTAAQYIAASKSWCAAMRALRPGVMIQAPTILPRGTDAGAEANRITANAWLMTGTTLQSGHDYSRSNADGGPDAIMDFAADATMGAPGSQNNATNYDTDLAHPTDTGHGILGPLEQKFPERVYKQDLVAPAVGGVAPSIDTTGLILTVNFTKPILPSGAAAITGFHLTGHTLGNGTRATAQKVTFPILSVVNTSEAPTLSAVGSNLTDSATNPLADFSLVAVTNGSSQGGATPTPSPTVNHVQARYTQDFIQPADPKWADYTVPVNLLENTVYPPGCLLEQTATPGKFQPYATGVPTLLLKRACATDANGLITEGAAATGMEQGQTYLTTDAYFAGLFRTQDLPQSGVGALDANALSSSSGKAIGRIVSGTPASGLLMLGARS